VVFSGGGSLGAVQVGQLRALLDHGVVPDLVVGSSIGALNAAAFAQNPTREGVAALEQIWKRAARTNTVFGYSKAGEIMRFALRREAVYPTSTLREVIAEGILFDQIEDAPLRYGVMTTALSGNPERCWWEGAAKKLVLASAAIPGVFPPVVYDGLTLIDGGVTNNVPINQAVEAGCTRIFVLLCKPVIQSPVTQGPRPIDSLVGAFALARQARLYSDLESVGDAVEMVIIPGTGKRAPYHTDLSATEQLIDEGELVADIFLDRAFYALAHYELGGGRTLALRQAVGRVGTAWRGDGGVAGRAAQRSK
jgi:NTE family protein